MTPSEKKVAVTVQPHGFKQVNPLLGVMLKLMLNRGGKSPKVAAPTPEKPCVNCKRPHVTGRAFCSAECCGEYKSNGNKARVPA